MSWMSSGINKIGKGAKTLVKQPLKGVANIATLGNREALSAALKKGFGKRASKTGAVALPPVATTQPMPPTQPVVTGPVDPRLNAYNRFWDEQLQNMGADNPYREQYTKYKNEGFDPRMVMAIGSQGPDYLNGFEGNIYSMQPGYNEKASGGEWEKNNPGIAPTYSPAIPKMQGPVGSAGMGLYKDPTTGQLVGNEFGGIGGSKMISNPTNPSMDYLGAIKSPIGTAAAEVMKKKSLGMPAGGQLGGKGSSPTASNSKSSRMNYF